MRRVGEKAMIGVAAAARHSSTAIRDKAVSYLTVEWPALRVVCLVVGEDDGVVVMILFLLFGKEREIRILSEASNECCCLSFDWCVGLN